MTTYLNKIYVIKFRSLIIWFSSRRTFVSVSMCIISNCTKAFPSYKEEPKGKKRKKRKELVALADLEFLFLSLSLQVHALKKYQRHEKITSRKKTESTFQGQQKTAVNFRVRVKKQFCMEWKSAFLMIISSVIWLYKYVFSWNFILLFILLLHS